MRARARLPSRFRTPNPGSLRFGARMRRCAVIRANRLRLRDACPEGVSVPPRGLFRESVPRRGERTAGRSRFAGSCREGSVRVVVRRGPGRGRRPSEAGLHLHMPPVRGRWPSIRHAVSIASESSAGEHSGRALRLTRHRSEALRNGTRPVRRGRGRSRTGPFEPVGSGSLGPHSLASGLHFVQTEPGGPLERRIWLPGRDSNPRPSG